MSQSQNASKDRAQSSRVETPIDELKKLVLKCVATQGHSQTDSEIITEVLLWAQLRGNNQGLLKLPAGAVRRSEHAAQPEVLSQNGAVTVLDGKQGYGMVVLQHATQEAIRKAKASGAGIVGTNNTSSSTGALGCFAEQIAQEGFIGLAIAQSPEFVAPHGATEAIFGTNPIAIGIPTADGSHPIVFDMATAAVAWYGLLEAKNAGDKVGSDIGFDSEGNVTTDPGEILNGGAIRNFTRDHKGSGMALILEILSGALVGGAMESKHASQNWGCLVAAVDPGLFGDKASFSQRVKQIVKRVKGAKKEKGDRDILLPGERGYREAERRRASGRLPMDGALLDQLRQMAGGLDETAAEPLSAALQEGAESLEQGRENGTSQSTQPPAEQHEAPALTAAKIEAQEDFNGPPNPPAGLPSVSFATRLLHPPKAADDPYGASSPPIYQTATFAQLSATDCGQYDYSRSGNPTRTQLEAQVADLEAATRSFAFVSGMAALSAVLRTISCGDHIVAGDDLYGGTSRLLAQVAPNLGLEVTHVDTTDVEQLRKALRPGKTKLVMLESPTNPRMQVCDLQSLTDAAHEAGSLVAVDNSIMTFLYQRPLDMGADISMTSATKFIGGHSDVMAGLLSVKDEKLAQRIYFHQNAEGTGLGPFDCWLLLRGIKTMSLRMDRQIANCAKLADFLQSHPLVKKINYPGLHQHPRSSVQLRQAQNGGSLLSFETGSLEASKEIVEQAKLFKVTVSFGNVTSQISLPCFMSHASIPAEVRAARGLPDDLIRISAGIEDANDLIKDLDQALTKATKKAQKQPVTSESDSKAKTGHLQPAN